MNPTVRDTLGRGRDFLAPARPVLPVLALLALLHWAELLVLPLLVFLARDPRAWLVVLVLGAAARGARLLLHQRARRRVRRAFMVRAALDSLRLREPAPAGSDAAFWGAHISEYALCVDVPAAAGAVLAGLVVVPLAALRSGLLVVTSITLVLAVAMLGDLIASRHRRHKVDAVVECRHQMAIWMAAALEDAGELGSELATSAFLRGVEERAGRWSFAEDGLERRRAIERGIVLLMAAGALLLLANASGLGGMLAHAPSWDNLGGFLLLGALLPAAYSLSTHLESLLVAKSEIARLLEHRGPERPRGTVRLSGAPCQLRADDLALEYGEHLALLLPALRLDLTRPTVITGPNGAGKTTFAKLLAGLTTPTRGQLKVDDVATLRLSPDDVAYVPQNPVLIEPLSVLQNLQLVVPDCSRERARSMLQALGAPRLDTILDSPAASLSRGEGRRIATARALLTPARLIVLDEPDAWLDATGRKLLVDALLERAGSAAIVLVSHRLDVIRRFDQIVSLSAEHTLEAVGDHQVVHEGSPAFRELSRSQSETTA